MKKSKNKRKPNIAVYRRTKEQYTNSYLLCLQTCAQITGN